MTFQCPSLQTLSNVSWSLYSTHTGQSHATNISLRCSVVCTAGRWCCAHFKNEPEPLTISLPSWFLFSAARQTWRSSHCDSASSSLCSYRILWYLSFWRSARSRLVASLLELVLGTRSLRRAWSRWKLLLRLLLRSLWQWCCLSPVPCPLNFLDCIFNLASKKGGSDFDMMLVGNLKFIKDGAVNHCS